MDRAQDLLRIVLRSARPVGDEICWPAGEVLEVLDAFAKLERVILGAELWRFDDNGSAPTVVGWTEFEVPEGTWAQRVAASSRLTADELLGHAGDLDAWVNLTWEEREDPEG